MLTSGVAEENGGKKMRLIDADALLKKYCKAAAKGDCAKCGWQGDSWCRGEIFGVQIDAAPTIDPASLRPKGGWVEKKQWHLGRWVAWYECSCCGERDDNYEMYEMLPFCHLPNFCPNCGANMRGNPNDS